MKRRKLIGPFKQLITFANTPLRGAISNEQMDIIEDAGILMVDGEVEKVASFQDVGLLFPEGPP